MPLAPLGRSDCAASFIALSLTVASNLEFGTVWSTSRHLTARGAAHALLHRAEGIGEVAAHLALVGDAGEAAGARQHGEQRQLGQGHRRVAVVGEQDVVGRQRQLVAAAGRRAADRAEILLSGGCARILHGVARLVGELAEVHLVRVGGAGQHADVGAGAEHAVLAGLEHHHLHLGVLETQPLHGIGKLDVDAQIVRVQLELVALEQAGVLVDVHQQFGHVAVELQLPVTVAGRLGLEVDALGHDGVTPTVCRADILARRGRRCSTHALLFLLFSSKCIIMQDRPEENLRSRTARMADRSAAAG